MPNIAASICAGCVLLALGTSFAAHAQPYGPDTCISGYVWREAYPGDHVCVTPARRAQAARDNQQAQYRVSTEHKDYGKNTCRKGYVWREAGPNDVVCVTPQVRQQVREDNAAARSRYVNR
jgi:hypothetical protein